ncbi:ImmA/IrrE family metallo-endopeptidase [Youngiibacter multivorans]|uniref:Zn-dependent peptidase ImmA (M78 family) n=1 Tax=Youngiibacter multivorans TaxID=937251 RepID=A0ABS4G046_9CLOT|nr:ImmA/IrrE family metallo-endopeptidase [Youngiibacter multivorans]MBP1917867.1 Zn-dependent peptidase ImmA (M78 family) [Youngiibacter multivorans]
MDKMDLWKKAVNLRKQLGKDATSSIDIFALAFSIEHLSIVYYPMGDRLSGICVKNSVSNVIAVNSAMTIGRQRFSLAHELYHLFFDDEKLTAICTKNIGVGSEKEIDADQFASYLLMPPDALSDMVRQIKKTHSDKLSVKDIVRIEQHFQISRQAVLSRLIAEKELTMKDSEPMRKNVILSALSLGYDDTLYKPTPKEKQYGTYGYYIQQVDRVAEKGLVSDGKYEELLLSAYRPDLVYGDDAEGGELLD